MKRYCLCATAYLVRDASVEVVATQGFDRAELADSPGDDRLEGRPDQLRWSGTGYELSVRGFDATHIVAGDGFDAATLTDTAGEANARRRWAYTCAAVLNAANEVAVAAFLERRLPFLGIAELIAATLDAVPQGDLPDLAAVHESDRIARQHANRLLTLRWGK